MQEDNNYCVYLHRNKRTGEVFYIGSGRPSRPRESAQRNTAWHVVVNSDGYFYEIVESNLTKTESLEKELILYLEKSKICTLVNKIAPRKSSEYDYEHINKSLYYDESSSTCLRRKIPGPVGRGGKPSSVGDEAGAKNSGPRLVKVGKKAYLIHKIVWLLFNKEIPKGSVIDHIDGDASNNRISNLRAITQAKNCRNQKKAKNNTSGVTGVIYHKYGNGKYSAWKAQYTDLSGKVRTKSFTVSICGAELAFKLACEYRESKIKEMNEQGAGYTDRHGT